MMAGLIRSWSFVAEDVQSLHPLAIQRVNVEQLWEASRPRLSCPVLAPFVIRFTTLLSASEGHATVHGRCMADVRNCPAQRNCTGGKRDTSINSLGVLNTRGMLIGILCGRRNPSFRDSWR